MGRPGELTTQMLHQQGHGRGTLSSGGGDHGTSSGDSKPYSQAKACTPCRHQQRAPCTHFWLQVTHTAPTAPGTVGAGQTCTSPCQERTQAALGGSAGPGGSSLLFQPPRQPSCTCCISALLWWTLVSLRVIRACTPHHGPLVAWVLDRVLAKALSPQASLGCHSSFPQEPGLTPNRSPPRRLAARPEQKMSRKEGPNHDPGKLREYSWRGWNQGPDMTAAGAGQAGSIHASPCLQPSRTEKGWILKAGGATGPTVWAPGLHRASLVAQEVSGAWRELDLSCEKTAVAPTSSAQERRQRWARGRSPGKVGQS